MLQTLLSTISSRLLEAERTQVLMSLALASFSVSLLWCHNPEWFLPAEEGIGDMPMLSNTSPVEVFPGITKESALFLDFPQCDGVFLARNLPAHVISKVELFYSFLVCSPVCLAARGWWLQGLA